MTDHRPLRLGVVGIGGRMGCEIVAAAADDPEVDLVGGTVGARRPSRDVVVYDTIAELVRVADVLLDFSTPMSAVAAAEAAADARIPIVIGTTGLDESQLRAVHAASTRTAVWYSRNTSSGIDALIRVLPEIARLLAGYDIELVEAHHRHKVDAPSGTALALLDAVVAGLDGGDHPLVHGRQGHAPRRPGEIGVSVVRGGGNAGEHELIFAGEYDEVGVSHRAYGRRAFASGAIRAARALAGRPPGWYGPVEAPSPVPASDR